MTLTIEAVFALAPDDASGKAARGLTSPSKWPLLGANDLAVWGECQGSGAKPYQTQVDLNGPAFRCSCPSRKFPCKHGLALLLIQAQSPALFQAKDAPAWVSEWLSSRAEKAQKKEERQIEKAAAPVDLQAAAKREAQRWQRMEAATQELQRWLTDQLAGGLGALDAESLKTWQTMAARMVDAQTPGLAQRIRDAAAGVRQSEDWPEQTLARLGMLQLVCDAMARRSSLSASLQAELRAVLGWPYDKADVLAEGERVHDHWTVLGVATEERDDKLTERRVWLQGAQTGRRAWLLDHAYGGRGFEQAWLTGTCVEGELVYFPGASGLRALAADLRDVANGAEWPSPILSEEWQRVAQRVAASPWVNWHPVVIPDAVPRMAGAQLALVVSDRSWPMALGEAATWTLLAYSGGHPVQIMGEWNGRALKPLTAWHATGSSALWQGGLA